MLISIQYTRLVAVLLLLSFFFPGLSFAGAEPVFVKENLEKSNKIWPGQRITLDITLYTTTSFSGSTRFELPKLSGMLIMENEGHPLLGIENVDGLSYIFKRHEIVLFPLRPGNLQMSPFKVEFSFLSAAGKVIDQSFTTQRLEFKVLEIPGVDPRKPVITTTNFKLNEQWNPEPNQAKVGDALVRTITFLADDLPGMVFPPLVLQRIDGLGIYQQPSQVKDQRQRGIFRGQRTEIITYICERKGSFMIPKLSFQWWNPRSETLRKVFLQEVEITVAAGPFLEKEGPTDPMYTAFSIFSWKWFAPIIPFLGLAITGFIRLRSRKQRRESMESNRVEQELLRELRKAANSNNAAATMQTLLDWLDHSKIAGNPPVLECFCDLAGDPELKKEIEFLEIYLYAAKPDRQWSGDKFFSTVQRARKNLKNQLRHTQPPSLPELNPGSSPRYLNTG